MASVAAEAQGGPSSTPHREVEWQMAAADLPAVRRWLADHTTVDSFVIEARPTLELHDTYFDTDDWRIHRAGLALRMRSASGSSEATLKGLQSHQSALADRLELSEPLPDGKRETLLESRGPVGTRVTAVVGGHSLHELFEIRTTRQRFAVRTQDQSADIGEIALDETVISRPHGEPWGSVTRVEVEALNPKAEPLEALVKTLRTQCSLVPVDESKYALGLKSLGLAPPAAPTFAPMNVDASMRMVDVALANLRRHLSAWLAHEPAARLGDDPEALHEMRVAARRMDAMLKMLGPYLPATLVRSRPTLEKLLDIFGTVRDLDVQIQEIDGFAADLAEEQRAALKPLQRHLRAERDGAREHMLAALNSAGTQRWINSVTRALVRSTMPHDVGKDAAAVSVAPDLIRRRFRKLRKAAKRLAARSSVDEYHLVRRQSKRLRYAIEAVAEIYGKPADETIRGLRRLQDMLGAQQDAHVARTRLLALANDPPAGLTSQTVFVMGRFVERHWESATRARKRVRKALRKIRGGSWKALRARLDELARTAPPRDEPAAIEPSADHRPAVSTLSPEAES